MSYAQHSVSTVYDILSRIRDFAAADGWVIDEYDTVTQHHELYIHKGNNYFSFKAADSTDLGSVFGTVAGENAGNWTNSGSAIVVQGNDGYSSSNSWYDQVGSLQRYYANMRFSTKASSFTSTPIDPVSVTLMSDTAQTCINIEAEEPGQFYQRMNIGVLELFNPDPNNGRYYCGSGFRGGAINNSLIDYNRNNISTEILPFRRSEFQTGTGTGYTLSSFLRLDYDGFNGWACSGGRGTVPAVPGIGVHGAYTNKHLREASPQTLNGKGVGVPIIVSVDTDGGAARPVGVMKGIRLLDITNYNPGDEFVYGGDTWKVFPAIRKDYGDWGNTGIAYLKVI